MKLKREVIREMTMQLIYQMDISDEFDVSKLNLMEEDAAVIEQAQAADTLAAIKDHLPEIDEQISSNLDKWKFERIAKTDLAIMRTAVAEILYLDYIPHAVSISEAVNLAKKYGDEKSYRFVNSVLGKIERSLENS